ncbi:hypothetical protein [Nostoc sp.]|uniref:hypothetical protein n=1 Tax=Nostoc sp. TaxID=1180 RepID=UPI002FF6F396
MMSYQVEIPKEQKVTRARVALESARELRRSKRLMGVDAIYQFVKDVDGEWLENWTDISDAEINAERVKISSIKIELLVFEFRLYVAMLYAFCVLVLNQMDSVNFAKAKNRDSITSLC